MIHNEDLAGHKTWRLIYGILFLVNLIFSPATFGEILTGIFAIVIAFLFWGQQLAINDIQSKNNS